MPAALVEERSPPPVNAAAIPLVLLLLWELPKPHRPPSPPTPSWLRATELNTELTPIPVPLQPNKEEELPTATAAPTGAFSTDAKPRPLELLEEQLNAPPAAGAGMMPLKSPPPVADVAIPPELLELEELLEPAQEAANKPPTPPAPTWLTAAELNNEPPLLLPELVPGNGLCGKLVPPAANELKPPPNGLAIPASPAVGFAEELAAAVVLPEAPPLPNKEAELPDAMAPKGELPADAAPNPTELAELNKPAAAGSESSPPVPPLPTPRPVWPNAAVPNGELPLSPLLLPAKGLCAGVPRVLSAADCVPNKP
mmetsp:Transcript_20779/g.37846  ORF Transcript_20779/g.37846 Transcript_20779/m.37846 type:complete len:312 (-) Transcript_20779:391-1326(-)